MFQSLAPLLFICVGLAVVYCAAKRTMAPIQQRVPVMSDTPHVTFDWNGHTIDFSDWDDDDYGEFEYTTRDGQYDFRFNLAPANIIDPDHDWWIEDEVVIFILHQPGYEGRATDGHSTHRIDYPKTGRKFVCVGRDQDPPTNVPDALSWAVYWAEETAEYIRTGASFS